MQNTIAGQRAPVPLLQAPATDKPVLFETAFESIKSGFWCTLCKDHPRVDIPASEPVLYFLIESAPPLSMDEPGSNLTCNFQRKALPPALLL